MASQGLVGAAIGLLVAVLGNVFLFPVILRMREQRFAHFYAGMPPEQAERRKRLVLMALRIQYRVITPILFVVIGYMFGIKLLGAL